MKIAKIILFTALLILTACSKEKEENITPIIYAERTIIVYMAADNDLSNDALNDLEEMKQGYIDNGINLIAFVDLAREAPYILEITSDSEKIIRTYPEINSADAAQMQKILEEVIGLYPAHSYGLILWSHATSWLPTGLSLRSFGQDNGKEINIPELPKSLPVKFNFILMDACLMGSVEVAYELKNKADFIIASSTETIYSGFPYDKIIPELIQPTIDFKRIGKYYFDYYNNLKGAYRSATISVIDTRHLQELSYQLKLLFENGDIQTLSIDRESIQRLDLYKEQYTFDLLDFVDKAFTSIDENAFINKLNQAVVYKAHTPLFLSEYEIKTYCGLSCYIPHPQRNDLNTYYKTLGWYKAAGIYHLF